MKKIKHNPQNAPTVFSEHNFFWDTKLTLDRMEEICSWINSLDKEQRGYLNDLLDDTREWAEFNMLE